MRREEVRIGLLGCGTVGGGVLQLLDRHADELQARVGARLNVRRALVRDLDKARGQVRDKALLTTEADDILGNPDIDLVVEIMGGLDTAGTYISRAIAAGKGVVTANKLLLAMRGPSLLEQAKEAGVDLAFEGAVGGGIPIVRTLREAFASDRVTAISGILNGTSNYVLSRMLDSGLGMAEAVAEAQQLGYAEADPTLDVGGHDAAQKLIILALLAFGAPVSEADVPVEGITDIEPVDHSFAARFGFRIKHLVIGRDHGDKVELRAHPTLIAERSVLANVSGVLNGVLIDGEALGPCLVTGQGAGALPTAVSVMSDVIDVARSIVAGAAGLQTRGIGQRTRTLLPAADVLTRFYVRFTVRDQPGVMARLAGSLGDKGVSIEQMVQAGLPEQAGGPATVVMLTHQARQASVAEAIEELRTESFMVKPPRLLRIEDV